VASTANRSVQKSCCESVLILAGVVGLNISVCSYSLVLGFLRRRGGEEPSRARLLSYEAGKWKSKKRACSYM